MVLIITNNDREIESSNYWDGEYAQHGYVFGSINAGALRLLVPDSLVNIIDEMKTAKKVVFYSGKYQGKEAFQLLFDDMTEEPFILIIDKEQVDRILPRSENNREFVFSVWTRGPKKVWETMAVMKFVKKLPCFEW